MPCIPQGGEVRAEGEQHFRQGVSTIAETRRGWPYRACTLTEEKNMTTRLVASACAATLVMLSTSASAQTLISYPRYRPTRRSSSRSRALALCRKEGQKVSVTVAGRRRTAPKSPSGTDGVRHADLSVLPCGRVRAPTARAGAPRPWRGGWLMSVCAEALVDGVSERSGTGRCDERRVVIFFSLRERACAVWPAVPRFGYSRDPLTEVLLAFSSHPDLAENRGHPTAPLPWFPSVTSFPSRRTDRLFVTWNPPSLARPGVTCFR